MWSVSGSMHTGAVHVVAGQGGPSANRFSSAWVNSGITIVAWFLRLFRWASVWPATRLQVE